MAVFQTNQGKRKETPPAGFQSGVRLTQIVEYVFNAAFATATDRIEMFVLPAGARLLGVRAIFAGVGSVNTSLGIMSGDVGSTDNARTVGTDIFSAQTMANGEVSATDTACLAIARDYTKHRSFGMIPAADIAASGSKKVTLIVQYDF